MAGSTRDGMESITTTTVSMTTRDSLARLPTTFGEWEQETWLGRGEQSRHEFDLHDPAPADPHDQCPRGGAASDVVIDATTWAASTRWSGRRAHPRARAPAFNIYSGIIDILINPDGSVVPTTIYSSPSSLQMDGSFYHFWLAERGDVYPPTVTATTQRPGLSGAAFRLPVRPAHAVTAISQANPAPHRSMPTPRWSQQPALPVIKGEIRIVTLFTRTRPGHDQRQVRSFNVNNVNQPFL